MLRSIIAIALLACTLISNNPTYAIAAGLFEIANVMYSITRPRRLTMEDHTNG